MRHTAIEKMQVSRGVHRPEAMMHFPPFSDFPPILVDNFQKFTFSRKSFRFSSAKISDDLFFLSSTKNFEFPPYFPCFSTFPPCFTKINFFPYFDKFLPLFSKNSPAFYIHYVYFVFPPTLTMMHLCISQCTYWMPLQVRIRSWLLGGNM